ncbi:arylamine N-acetyltransferase family protein [Halobaculum magnesiiphilum]|uniref:Arylamine N-acetyltransferase n=1 Tax=Halobaculum magnesiiphilum TaxID=1017351 RepID=A0A8T8WEZ6_9EURY|nr:arylamine N-acetyltransferase [Halobaculum magnesiiphilum]QZP38356.1 arylamine N-acetyltransferase [Halobaculum magnesiiphilum]
MDTERTTRHLARIGVDPATVSVDREGLRRLQRAHVRSVPFETLSVAGHPHRADDAEGVDRHPDALYGKIVDRGDGRGGFCYELNELFRTLLSAVGFDVTRVAARVADGADDPGHPPANHQTTLVSLPDAATPVVADVGMGVPTMRRPTPLSGEHLTDEAGVSWRVRESERPDADYRTEYRRIGDEEWTVRYRFRTVARECSFYAAACEYLTAAPESPFTGDPVVSRATTDGHLKLRPDELVRFERGEETSEPVAPASWDVVAREEFGLAYEPG